MTTYDQGLDRLDVAVKAILTLYRNRRWGPLAELGVGRDAAPGLERALASSDLPVARWREAQVLAACVAEPWLVEVAVLLQARYQARAGGSR